MQRFLRFLQRNILLLAATAVLMAGAGCLGAVHETHVQLNKDSGVPALLPLTGSATASVE